MSGYNEVTLVRRLEKECAEFGLALSHPRNYSGEYGVYIAVKPKDEEAFPVYDRDAELFAGTLEDLSTWLRGIEWSRQYDMMIGLSTCEERKRKEQDVRNKQVVQLIKGERVERLASRDNEDDIECLLEMMSNSDNSP